MIFRAAKTYCSGRARIVLTLDHERIPMAHGTNVSFEELEGSLIKGAVPSEKLLVESCWYSRAWARQWNVLGGA